MENSKTEVAKRKRWTPEEKTMILMRYLKDRVSFNGKLCDRREQGRPNTQVN